MLTIVWLFIHASRWHFSHVQFVYQKTSEGEAWSWFAVHGVNVKFCVSLQKMFFVLQCSVLSCAKKQLLSCLHVNTYFIRNDIWFFILQSDAYLHLLYDFFSRNSWTWPHPSTAQLRYGKHFSVVFLLHAPAGLGHIRSVHSTIWMHFPPIGRIKAFLRKQTEHPVVFFC